MSPTTAMVKPSSTVVASCAARWLCAVKAVDEKVLARKKIKESDLLLTVSILVKPSKIFATLLQLIDGRWAERGPGALMTCPGYIAPGPVTYALWKYLAQLYVLFATKRDSIVCRIDGSQVTADNIVCQWHSRHMSWRRIGRV